MRKYEMQYKEKISSDFGLVLYDCAKISEAKRHYDIIAVSGRFGELVSQENYRSNITIECYLAVLNGHTTQQVRNLKEWLSGTGNLQFSDSPETFYKVLKISYVDLERKIRQYGRFTVSFLCKPVEYLLNGKGLYSIEQLELNPYPLSFPIYKIKGNGKCTLNVNGNIMTANVSQNLIIDTDLLQAYKDDGTLQNTSVTGDYESLRLIKGKNSIKISDGFDLKAIPNWGYDI